MNEAPRTFDELMARVRYELRWPIRLLKVVGVLLVLRVVIWFAEAVLS